MAQIGIFRFSRTGYTGQLRTLALNAKLVLVPVDKADAENAPDFRVHLGTAEGAEVGAAWKRTGEKAGEYLSVQLDDPVFAQPIRANLFQSNQDATVWFLNWNRPRERTERE
ncbi:DUF736 domain-containing protein [Plastorhodobacter daqingensis]|uniref:DUF736 domain-containing protein n=1 Tax=Plastorhodobacter daqingensis TaxID=1387281 RepID=A0ABW2UNG5_9RHOB